MRTRDFRRIFPKGATIFSEGEVGHCAYIIERGSVEITTRSGGEDVVLATRGAGEIFGEMAIVDNKPRSATATAVEECDLNILSQEQLSQRLQMSDPVLRMVLSVVLDRFRDTLQAFKSETLEGAFAVRSGGSGAKLQVHQAAIDRIKLEQELEQAIKQEELVLHFQPLIDFESERVAGFEALVRWQHPQRGLIPPLRFLDVAEESGLIVQLGRWVLEQSCRALGDLTSAAKVGGDAAPDLFMCVNVSAPELCLPEYLANLTDTIDRTGIDPSNLKLEVTESLLVENPELARETLDECVSHGIKVAIDDFGTGYSSLAYLHKFPIETIKIDRSFVTSIFDGGGSMEIIRATIELARSLGMVTVAEGIDQEAQETFLRRFGCSYGQGFFYAKPMPFDKIRAFIESWPDRRGEAADQDEIGVAAAGG